MAAAILLAARRLGGLVLQRTQTELPRRLVHSAPRGSSLRPPPTQAALGKIHAQKEINKKKEELFTLIADTQRRYGARANKTDIQNIRMLQQLAVQIQPRPADPLWAFKTVYKETQ